MGKNYDSTRQGNVIALMLQNSSVMLKINGRLCQKVSVVPMYNGESCQKGLLSLRLTEECQK